MDATKAKSTATIKAFLTILRFCYIYEYELPDDFLENISKVKELAVSKEYDIYLEGKKIYDNRLWYRQLEEKYLFEESDVTPELREKYLGDYVSHQITSLFVWTGIIDEWLYNH